VLFDGFVDIIKQLEVVDVHILNYIYSNILERNLKDSVVWKTEYKVDVQVDPIRYGVHQNEIQDSLRISRHAYECAVDNLLRVRCLAPYLEDIDVPGEFPDTASRVYEYELVSITPFGWDFVRSCSLPASPGASKE